MTEVDYDLDALDGPWARTLGVNGLVTLADVAPERVRWLWPGRLPLGKLVVVDGDPGLGKSTLLLDLAARVSTGSSMPDGARLDGPRDVVLLSAEDGLADTIRPRLDAAGADSRRVHALVEIEALGADGETYQRPPSLPADAAHLERIIERTSAAMVIVDVLAAYLGAGVDAYRDTDIRRALHQLAGLAEHTGSVVVCVRHLSKTGGANPLYRGGGSIGITAAARAGLLIAADPDDETGGRRILAVSKSNLAEIPSALAYRLVGDELHGCARVVWEGATGHRATDLLATSDPDERSARTEAETFLIEQLAAGPVPSKTVFVEARKLGIADRTLKRAKAKLGIEARKLGMDGGWVWASTKDANPDPKKDEEGHAQDVAPFDLLRGERGPLR